jgi:hypothetical protein
MGNSVNKLYNAKICVTVKISFFNKQKLRYYNGENEICGSGTRGTRDAKIRVPQFQAVVLQQLGHGMSQKIKRS